jgi:hypothetical protein
MPVCVRELLLAILIAAGRTGVLAAALVSALTALVTALAAAALPAALASRALLIAALAAGVLLLALLALLLILAGLALVSGWHRILLCNGPAYIGAAPHRRCNRYAQLLRRGRQPLTPRL